MSGRYEVVDEVRFGDQEHDKEGVPSEWKTVRAVFPNFAELPSKRGDFTLSPVLKCHGLEWRIRLHPGGDTISSEKDVFVSLYLSSMSSTDTRNIKAKFYFRVPTAGKARGVGAFTIFKTKPWGHKDFAKRKDFLDSSKNFLVDRSLTIEVDIQVMLDKPPVWTPTNTVCSDMLSFLKAVDPDSTIPAVVAFEVSLDDGKELLHAHGQILAARCPALAELAEDGNPDTPIPIGDVQADVFRMLLRFIYGGEVPSKEVIENQAKNIIHAADKYGCTGLKLAAEAEMAAAGITTESAAELILFADATNCAMLKETAMDFFVKNTQEVMASEGFAQVKESPAVLTELMAAMASGSKKRPASSDVDSERDFKRMCVATLRQKLDEKKLDVDGSKDMLISRLEAAEAEARAQAEAEAQARAEALAQAEAENEDEDE